MVFFYLLVINPGPMMKTELAGLICLFIALQANAQNDSTASTPLVDNSINVRDTIPVLSFNVVGAPVKKQPVYKLKPIVDVPLTAINSAWTLYAFTKIY